MIAFPQSICVACELASHHSQDMKVCTSEANILHTVACSDTLSRKTAKVSVLSSNIYEQITFTISNSLSAMHSLANSRLAGQLWYTCLTIQSTASSYNITDICHNAGGSSS